MPKSIKSQQKTQKKKFEQIKINDAHSKQTKTTKQKTETKTKTKTKKQRKKDINWEEIDLPYNVEKYIEKCDMPKIKPIKTRKDMILEYLIKNNRKIAFEQYIKGIAFSRVTDSIRYGFRKIVKAYVSRLPIKDNQ